MSLLEDFFLGSPKNDMERLLDRGVGQYRIESLSADILDSLWDTEDEELDRDSKRADIAYKKAMAASLPQSSQDYDDAVNNGLSFKENGVLAAFGVHAANRTPDPKAFRPQRSSLSDKLFSGKTMDSNPKLADELYHSTLGRGGKNVRSGSSSIASILKRIRL